MQNVLVLRQAVLLRVLVTPGASVSCTVTFRALKLYFSYEPNIFLQTLENINNQIQILNDVRPRFFFPPSSLPSWGHVGFTVQQTAS